MDARGDDVHTPEDFAETDFEVYVGNWDAISLYRQFDSQWRHGFNGPYALDFNVFQHALDRKGVVGEKYDTLMWQLGIIEAAALNEFHKK